MAAPEEAVLEVGAEALVEVAVVVPPVAAEEAVQAVAPVVHLEEAVLPVEDLAAVRLEEVAGVEALVIILQCVCLKSICNMVCCLMRVSTIVDGKWLNATPKRVNHPSAADCIWKAKKNTAINLRNYMN